jgi:GTPase Era involved in 16S rRNA processing
VNISDISKRHYEWVESQGWHNKTNLECLALIASEVGEAINECRGHEPTSHFKFELADIILRTLDLAHHLGINIEEVLLSKIHANANKSDVKKPSYIVQYKFMADEFDVVIELSALKRMNINTLIDTIFGYLPEREQMIDTKDLSQPGLNIDSKTFVSELIREKAFLNLRKEVPYSITSIVDELVERENGTMYIRGRILTSDDRYKAMIVGKGGTMIKEISMAVRKEMEVASGKKVYVELTVEVDPHWMEYL